MPHINMSHYLEIFFFFFFVWGGGREGSNKHAAVNCGKITDSSKKEIVFVLQESTCEDSDDSTLHARVLITVACSFLLNCAAFCVMTE